MLPAGSGFVDCQNFAVRGGNTSVSFVYSARRSTEALIFGGVGAFTINLLYLVF